MNQENDAQKAPIRVYQQIAFPNGSLPSTGGVVAKFCTYLPDRPGSLSAFASTIARTDGNISFFHSDRSMESSRVAVEAQFNDGHSLDTLLSSLQEKRYSFEKTPDAHDDIFVTTVDSVMEIKVRLANKPGAHAAFAELLAAHGANVMYMLYNEMLDPESADIALATASPQEINALLQAINERGCHYRVVYRGSGEQKAANIIGLKMVEKFFLRLKRLLPASDIAEIKSLVESSRELYQDLVLFATEAGDVYETVLTFASRSRSRTGGKFAVTEMRPLRFRDCVDLFGFRLPTSENIYLFRDS